MNESRTCARRLSDHELVAEVTRLAAAESQSTAALISVLAEFDARRLYLGQGCSSMFTYCTQVLHLAEHAAYNRIEAARAARRFPIVLDLLGNGRIHLSAIRLLAPHLTESNHRDVLAEASHRSKREIEEIVARLQPRPDVAPSVRRLPTGPTPHSAPDRAIEASTCEKVPARIVTTAPVATKTEPLAPGRYKVQFTIVRDTYDKLRRVQDLLRHRLPSGDPATILDRALSALLESLEKEKLAATNRPRGAQPEGKHSRYLSAAVRRTVWAHDGGRCRFEGPAGRCQETGFLEFHHVEPYALGGATTAENLELRCAAHNHYEAERDFGLFAREMQPHWVRLG